MNAQRLLAHYERVADAPNAIARIRRFVLDLAMRGKLVPQDSNDEPASEFLRRVVKEKERLVNAVEISGPREIKPITGAEAPYVLPKTWNWVHVGDIFNYDAGLKRDPKELDQTRWLLELEDIEKDTSRLVQRFRVSDRDPQSTKSEFEVGDILYGKLRPYLNKVLVADEPGYSTTEIVAIRPFLKLCPEYCALAFRRPDFVAYVERLGRGTKMPRLRTPDAVIAAFPLPPLSEQHRIVAKVDELMALCDRIEAAQGRSDAARDRLAAANFARISAPDPETFSGDVRLILDALPALSRRPDQIRHLRQAILDLAASGKLVSQESNDESATQLLERILHERSKQAKQRRIRGDSIPTGPNLDQLGFELPRGWAICALGQITIITDPNPTHRYPNYTNGTVPILSTQEFAGLDDWNTSSAKLTTAEFWNSQREHCAFDEGDIVFARKGRLGLPRFLPKLARFTFSHTVFVIKPMPGVVPSYLLWMLRRDATTKWLTGEMNQNTGVPTLGKAKTEKLPVALPPVAEQHRIVAKVGRLMTLCDQLEAGLTSAAGTRRRLLEALLAEALAPAEDRELQAAE